MSIIASKMKKAELIVRDKFRCPHGRNAWEHPRCFKKYNKNKNFDEKILYFDIEAEGLNADYSIMFNWYAIDNKGKHFEDYITKKDIKKYSSHKRDIEPKEDSRIVKSLIDLMSKYTRVVGHYHVGYDIPFTRTRAVIDKIDFPTFGVIFQTDTWMILRKKFKLSRNSLENGCRKLVGKTNKDKLTLSIKHGCLRGETWAINLSRKHCKQDVIDTEALFTLVSKYMKRIKSSI